MDCLGDDLLILDGHLRPVSAVGASDRFHLFLLLELGCLLRLYVNNALVVARAFASYWLALRYPLLGCSRYSCTFSVVNVLLRGLHDLVSDGFLHQVNLALPYDLHQLVLQRNYQLLIPLIFGRILVATSQSL